MKGLWAVAQGEPVRFMAIITALGAVAALLGVPAPVYAAVGGVIAAVLAFPIRNGVNTVAKTVQVANDAAQTAAAQTAAALTSATAGAVGEVTLSGQVAVLDAVSGAVDTTLKNAGFSRKDRQAA